MSEPKRLYLSEKDKKFAGVCGGIAEFYNIDSTLVRLVWTLATVFSWGIGILAYLAAMLIIPSAPEK